MPIPADYIPVTGLHPEGVGECDFFISKSMLEKLETDGPTIKYEDAEFTVIFRGLQREEYEDGFCYSGVPQHDWQDAKSEITPRPGMVFLVYVRPQWGI